MLRPEPRLRTQCLSGILSFIPRVILHLLLDHPQVFNSCFILGIVTQILSSGENLADISEGCGGWEMLNSHPGEDRGLPSFRSDCRVWLNTVR